MPHVDNALEIIYKARSEILWVDFECLDIRWEGWLYWLGDGRGRWQLELGGFIIAGWDR